MTSKMFGSRVCLYKGKLTIFVILSGFVTFSIHNLLKTKHGNDPLSENDTRISSNPKREYWTKVIASNKTLPEDKLIEVISKVFVDLPPPPDRKYHFDTTPPKITGQIGIPVIVDKILEGKRDGFFIEAGGLDGEAHSNTLLFELERNYSGLLIEPGLDYSKLLSRNRKVTSVNACLATKDTPHVVEFLSYRAVGGIKGEVKGWAAQEVEDNAKVIQATCLPFISIMLAIGNPTIDYFSLDIEGVELDVLNTIPWKKVDIKVFSIEVGNNGRERYGEKVDRVMVQAGYTKVLNLCCDRFELDNVYVRNDVRSSFFSKDNGRPRLIKEKFDLYGKMIS